VFAFVMRFMFDRLDAARIVVEPDANNAKIHALNLAMGFTYAGQARFRDKTASLAFCTRTQFEQVQYQESTP
jgi:RimJ/RimL family protein N-acetyltransferase